MAIKYGRILIFVMALILVGCTEEPVVTDGAAAQDGDATSSSTPDDESETPGTDTTTSVVPTTEPSEPDDDPANDACDAIAGITPEDCGGLLSLFEGLGGPTSWFQTGDACDWEGVTCEDTRVSGLWLTGVASGGVLSVGDMPGSLGELRSLTVEGEVSRPNSNAPIDVISGGINSVSPDISALGSLERLELIGLGELVLPDELAELGSLRRLDLVGFTNTTVPEAVYGLDLEAAVFQLPELTDLDVPDTAWPNLLRLFIVESSLVHERMSLGSIASLEVLLIQYSPLGSVPSDVLRQSSLTSLALPNASLNSADGDWSSMTQLSSVDLSSNELVTVPPSFFVDSLKHLDLTGNRLESVPDEILLPDYERLKLGQNELSSVPLGLFEKPMDFALNNNAFNGDVSELIDAYLSGEAWLEFQLFELGCVQIDDGAVRELFESTVTIPSDLSTC